MHESDMIGDLVEISDALHGPTVHSIYGALRFVAGAENAPPDMGIRDYAKLIMRIPELWRGPAGGGAPLNITDGLDIGAGAYERRVPAHGAAALPERLSVKPKGEAKLEWVKT